MKNAGPSARALALILAATAVLIGSASPASAAAPDKTQGFFPVSVWYSGGKARAPMLETVTPKSREVWKKDIDQIKRLGFNTVRTWIEWTACEKTEGKYDFSALELLTDLAGEAGLRVIVQVYIDSAPDWVGVSLPDSKFVSSNGVAVESQASPGFCFDHAGVQEKILSFFKAAARAVKGKPAFYGWDLWSEPHIINWAEVYYVGDLSSVQFCYCHSTQARFREWLKKKYGTIEALNKAWYRTLASFDEVQPPRFGTILTFTDYIDWKEFISDKLAEDLALKAAAVKSVLPDTVVTSHSAGPGIFTRPDWSGTPDDRKMSDSVDFYGASIYPKHAWTIKPWSPFYRSSGLDFVRSMGIGNGGFYIGELQAGYGVFGMKMSLPVVGTDTRDWMWST
ncbi:MAG: beta-galactosidase, partial [Candidatus Aminicenantales bacterium]